jgi:ribosome-binding protein aMBF1 (putative translation factor)
MRFSQGTHYRILYFFHGRAIVVVSHGLKKERIVPPTEIDLAIRRRAKFESARRIGIRTTWSEAVVKAGRSRQSRSRRTSDAIAILRNLYVKNDPEMARMVEEERANMEVARRICDLRRQAGLTQRALAKLVGTTASVICRLEDADYEGHSLAMLNRIAAALDRRVEIRFVAAVASSKKARKRSSRATRKAS